MFEPHGGGRGCAIAAMALLATAACPAADQSPQTPEPAIVCVAAACTVVAGAAYPGLVIGSVERVLTPSESAEFFSRAMATGAWRDMPGDAKQFTRLVRGVALRTRAASGDPASAFSFVALMTEDEYRDAGLDPGVLVRYAPHGPEHDAPPADQPELLPYWGFTGCVMALCRQGDGVCEGRYLPGVYERATGAALDWRSAKPASMVPLINPRTQLPLPSPSPSAPTPAPREPDS